MDLGIPSRSVRLIGMLGGGQTPSAIPTISEAVEDRPATATLDEVRHASDRLVEPPTGPRWSTSYILPCPFFAVY
jgi:hypothetical protein